MLDLFPLEWRELHRPSPRFARFRNLKVQRAELLKLTIVAT